MAKRWTKMPPDATTPKWERWACDMLRRGFSAWEVAGRSGVSETRVTQAYHREEARRDAERG